MIDVIVTSHPFDSAVISVIILTRIKGRCG